MLHTLDEMGLSVNAEINQQLRVKNNFPRLTCAIGFDEKGRTLSSWLFSVVVSHDFAPAELSLPSLHPHSPMSDCFEASGLFSVQLLTPPKLGWR
jgi:hypothetical protein